jgi:hypothetical protein
MQITTKELEAMSNEYRWEYSPLAQAGNWVWAHCIDPLLRFLAPDDLTVLRRGRGLIQVLLVVSLLMIPISFFYQPSHVLTASGLLFDIAGVLRLFLLEEIEHALEGFRGRDNLPSVAMRELIMPEASGPYTAESDPVSLFYYSTTRNEESYFSLSASSSK